MASTNDDRQALVYQSYKDAFERRSADLMAATSADQAKAVMANISALEAAWLTAANEALDATGPAIEGAYDAAVAAKQKVDAAYAANQALTAKIGAVGALVGKVGDLVTAASGKGGTGSA
jgi:hypothetical protein